MKSWQGLLLWLGGVQSEGVYSYFTGLGILAGWWGVEFFDGLTGIVYILNAEANVLQTQSN
jgi:hypothetical protein